MPEDRIILGVLPVQGDLTKELLRYDIHNLDAIGTPRYRLVGFSFFGEVDGSRPTADNRYVHLQDPTENVYQLPTPGCNYGLSNPPLPIIRPYGQWLNDLACRRISFSRVFLFASEEMTKYFPQDKFNGDYVLTQIAQRYIDRLTQYVLWAKQNNIVVCLTLFNDYMLRVGDPTKPRPADGFFVNPFNNDLNTPSFDFITVADTDNDQIIRQKFYRIQPPAGTIDYDKPETWPNFGSWSNEQKLYATQRYLVTRIVNLTKDHWNVMYEISNEPRPADTLQYPHQSEDWLFQVASWLDGLLWDANFNRRKRLVVLNLGSGAFRTSVLKRLLTGANHHLFDVFSFHGTEWSHPPGVADPTFAQIQSTISTAVSAFYNTDVSTTPAKKVRDYPITILLDADANYSAQDGPTKYLKAALGLKVSFNYRWSGDFIGELTNKLEDINHGNPPTGFSITPVSDAHSLTFRWNPVPQATGYRIRFYPPSSEYPAYLGYGTVGAPAANSEINIAGGATTQYAVNYPGTFCVSATIRAYFANGEETAESAMIRVAAGQMFDCEVVGFSLPSGDLTSRTYAGWIELKNTGWFPWTRYTLREVPGNVYTFDVSLGVGNTPTGYPFAYSERFVIQPQDPNVFVKTGQTYRFPISYMLPSSTGTLYVHHYFDQYTIVPGYSSSRIKDLGIVRGVRVIAQAAP